MDRVKVGLIGEKATLLITLYAKALDSRSEASILHDTLAQQVVGRIDYDFGKLALSGDQIVGLALRAKMLDDWTQTFLAAHPDAIVLNLACGLDTRVFRIDPAPSVPWIDVDYAEVIELRRRLMPARQGYRMIGASVVEAAWLDQVPADRPVMIVAEGLSPYLLPEDGVALLRRLTQRLLTGEIALDAYNWLGLRLIRTSSVVRHTGARLHWAIEDARELETLVPGLTLIAEASTFDATQARRYSLPTRVLLLIWNLFPPLRRIGRLLRYRF
jgi:O-methyltransferase involved in polyketide biosynthesis